ncbi:hypothetical protein J437_LFUL012070 [Ladona fulva]|uniref:Uncharacterized protein n=1 Tax=Ladona fulva TaxID=123851 RepID=A0A8K0KGA9_LADFU|nr:hypothetical protein J437_LFUL012070 [Ladona fulva]
MRVTHLDIEGCQIFLNLSDSMLGLMLQRCGMSLTRLDLPHIHKLSGDTLHVIASLCRNLEHLSAHSVRVTISAVNQLTMKCRQLKTLILREPISIRDRDIQILFDKLNLETFALKQRNIEGLCLSHLPPTLKHLDLTSCNDLIMPSLLSGLSRTPNLRTLELINCVSLTKTDFESICMKVPQLEELSVSEYFPNLSTYALDSIQNLKNLRKLNMRLNDFVDDRLVTLISTSCMKLEVLDISGCNGTMSSNGVTDSGIRAVALNSNVTNLSMSYLSGVTDVSLFHLAESGKIKWLYCQGCPEITDTGCSSGSRNVTSKTTNTAIEVVESFRSDAKKMHLIVGGTLVKPSEVHETSKGLKIDLSDNCIDRLRPDFSHDALYASSEDGDDYEALDLDSDNDDYDPYPYEFDSELEISDSELQFWE